MKQTWITIRIEADPGSDIRQLQLQLNRQSLLLQPVPVSGTWQQRLQISGALDFSLIAQGDGAFHLLLQGKRTILRKTLALDGGSTTLTIEGIPLLG